MKLTALKYGETDLAESAILPQGKLGRARPIALLFFLIEQGSQKILVDVGCDTMPGFELRNFCSPVEVLREYGLNESEITDVVITHAHHDHIDALRYYPQAKVYIHQEALEAAARYLPSMENVRAFESSQRITDGVWVQYVGGHAKGSSVVLIATSGKTLVLCGDECYAEENLRCGIPTPSTVDPQKSLAFIKEYGKDVYQSILFHDAHLVETGRTRVLLTF